MIEVCAACRIEIDADTKVCPICMEPVGTIMIPEEECPKGGDNTDCESCIYYPDYKWDDDKEDCIRNEN